MEERPTSQGGHFPWVFEGLASQRFSLCVKTIVFYYVLWPSRIAHQNQFGKLWGVHFGAFVCLFFAASAGQLAVRGFSKVRILNGRGGQDLQE